MTQVILKYRTAILMVAVFLCASCRTYQVDNMKGHWWVKEGKAGYLEFVVDGDSMHVCSPKYGQLYHGRIEVKKNQLIQYKEENSEEVRLIGVIEYLESDSMVLRYGETIEHCLRISVNLPIIQAQGCYIGSEKRLLLQN
jgi:hypothetical protein